MNVYLIMIAIILIIAFSIIAVTIYKKNMSKLKNNPNNEFIKNEKTAELIIFYASWCPHSQSALKSWYNYKQNYNGNYNISFTEIDCDENPSIADSYNIDSYPTIILVNSDKKYIYDAQMNDDTLTQFINTIMK